MASPWKEIVWGKNIRATAAFRVGKMKAGLEEESRRSSATADVTAVANGHRQASAFEWTPIIDDQWNGHSDHS
jgi:hypothetical protein